MASSIDIILVPINYNHLSVYNEHYYIILIIMVYYIVYYSSLYYNEGNLGLNINRFNFHWYTDVIFIGHDGVYWYNRFRI